MCLCAQQLPTFELTFACAIYFELWTGPICYSSFGAKNKIVEIDLQLAKEWNYQEYQAKENLKQFLLDCLV